MAEAQHKAWSVLQNRSINEDEEFVHIEGIASTPEVDRVGDVVEPLGAQFKTPMPLLLYHSHTAPVGNVTFAKPTAKGIPFKAVIPKVKESGVVQDRVNEAIHSLKYNLISAVSIGFRAVPGEVEQLKTGGLRFLKWVWFELSLVPVPAQPSAVIQLVKSLQNDAASAGKSAAAEPAAEPLGATKRGPVTLIERRRPHTIRVTPKRKIP